MLQKQREYYAKNKARVSSQNKKWHQENPDALREIKRRWKAKNKDVLAYHVATRRMRIKQQIPPDADLKAIKEFYRNCPEGMEVDHIIPISRGGLHTLGNLQYLPMAENRSKGAKLPHELKRAA